MTIWRTVDAFKGQAVPVGSPCPHLSPTGCRLPEDQRPAGCRSYLCDISDAVAQGKISREDGLRCVAMRAQKEQVKAARTDLLREGSIVRVGREVGTIVYANLVHNVLVYGVLLDDGVWDVISTAVEQITSIKEKL